MKKALIVGGAAGLGATAGSVISGGVIAPIAGAAISATVADVVATSLWKDPDQTSVVAETVTYIAPDNFWTLLGKLVETGGWVLLLVLLVPMVLGWILPGPLERKKKNS